MFRCAAAALVLAAVSSPSFAQLARLFPSQALRGELAVTQPPEVRLNGRPARFSPGVRIRDEDNRFVVWGSVVGRVAVVHYTLDPNGDLRDVWLLTETERRNLPWPTTRSEAERWTFDPTAQIWSRR